VLKSFRFPNEIPHIVCNIVLCPQGAVRNVQTWDAAIRCRLDPSCDSPELRRSAPCASGALFEKRIACLRMGNNAFSARRHEPTDRYRAMPADHLRGHSTGRTVSSSVANITWLHRPIPTTASSTRRGGGGRAVSTH